MKQKALRARDAHSHEDEDCRKRPRSARECAEAHSFLCISKPIRNTKLTKAKHILGGL